MPIYEYQCEKCGHTVELMQSMNDPAPAECPECGAKKKMAKVMSRSSFQLKGGGWYAEGYSSSSSKKSDK